MNLAAGALIEGRYEIVARIAQGGMAVVYQVRHRQLGTRHALKVLTVQSPSVHARLMAEGRIQAALRHPNAVAVTDVVSVDGNPALIMEYVDGPSLQRLLEQRPLSWDEADAIGRGVLAGVAAAHALGIVHRDLKPGNILVEALGRAPVAKVADFGLVKLLREDAESVGSTRSGATLGTPAYMAPEQIRDASTVDARADVFSLGAVLYELCTGRRAFRGADLLELFNRVAACEYIPVRELAPHLPDRAVRAIESALRQDPDDRAQTVETLLETWTGGTLPPAPWDTVRTAEVRSMAPTAGDYRPSTAPIESNETFGLADEGGETSYPAPVTVHVAATPAPAPSAPPRPSPLSLGLPVAIGLVGLVAVAWWAWPRPAVVPPAPTPPVPVAAPPPVVAPSPRPSPELPVPAISSAPRPRTPSPAPVSPPTPPAVPAPIAAVPEPPAPVPVVDGPKVRIDSDVTVIFRDPSGHPVDAAHLVAGSYTVLAFFAAGEATAIQTVTLTDGEVLAIRCRGAAQRCILTRE